MYIIEWTEDCVCHETIAIDASSIEEAFRYFYERWDSFGGEPYPMILNIKEINNG